MKKTQITVWKQTEFTMETVDGLVKYEDWCNSELIRLGEDTHFIEYREVPRKVNEICIMRREENDNN